MARNNIFHVVERAFVEGASTPFVSLETRSVPFVMQREWEKQMKKWKREWKIRLIEEKNRIPVSDFGFLGEKPMMLSLYLFVSPSDWASLP